MKGKIGLGVITCNREDYYKRCVGCVDKNKIDVCVTVNDGHEYHKEAYPEWTHLIQHSTNKCVGISKNEALRYLIQNDCEHLFLIEDDILVKDNNVFEQYIKTAFTTGIYRLSYALHGPANLKPDKTPNPRAVIEYPGGIKLALYPNCVGSFEYMLKGMIKNCGYMDEIYKNAWEHVAHSYKMIKKGLLPPFWWFPDIGESYNYLDEIASSEVSSVIRPRTDWKENMQKGAAYFKYTTGYYPTEIPQTPKEQVLEILKDLKKKYSRKLDE